MKLLKWFKLPEARRVGEIDSLTLTQVHKGIIRRKPFLRRLYEDFYRQCLDLILANSRETSLCIEIGSGGGFSKTIINGLITSDVLFSRDVDLVFSAQEIPLKSESVDFIFMLNVFHHLANTKNCLKEIERCLTPGGKLMMIEPANTPLSRLIYKYLHHEYFDHTRGWTFDSQDPLFSANGALPWIVFCRDRQQFVKEFPALKIRQIYQHTPLRYLLSGGLSYRQFLPGVMYPLVRGIETMTAYLNPFTAMFMTVIVEKK